MRGGWQPFAVSLVFVAACGTEDAPQTGQILLYVDTDAPMPGTTGAQPPPTEPLPLFDRVRIEIVPPGSATPCSGCSNDFELDTDRLRTGVSVGIVPRPGQAGYRARVRIYRAAFVSPAGEPDPDTSIDTTVALPPVAPTGIVERTALLLTDNVGRPSGSLDAPAALLPARPKQSLVGTWAPSRRVPCSGAPHADEVCLPGGAFFMGNPLAKNVGFADQGTRPHLVVLSPYFLKKTETTVGELRAVNPAPVNQWSGSVAGTAGADWCTFSPSPEPCGPGTFACEDDAVNCVTWSEARAFCQARGGDLPTEAEYEYAASGLLSQLFVWGADAPTCGDAIYARGGDGTLASTAAPCGMGGHGGPTTPGMGLRDQLVLATGTVLDLAANVGEWAQDAWNRDSEPCWAQPGIYKNPVCTTPSTLDPPGPALRGGTWIASAPDLEAAVRYNGIGMSPLQQGANIQIGFRCARPDGP